jgi:phosphoribosyl-AMP cyclohydrolase
MFETIAWNSDGLVPAIVQDSASGDVLMLAWMDRHALAETIRTGQTHFYSRSRKKHWHKGETSGHAQHVVEIRFDCDADVLLIRVRQVGGACHEGYRTCFFRELKADGSAEVVESRVFDPDAVYHPTGPH